MAWSLWKPNMKHRSLKILLVFLSWPFKYKVALKISCTVHAVIGLCNGNVHATNTHWYTSYWVNLPIIMWVFVNMLERLCDLYNVAFLRWILVWFFLESLTYWYWWFDRPDQIQYPLHTHVRTLLVDVEHLTLAQFCYSGMPLLYKSG